MTLILAAQFPTNRFMLSLSIPAYRPSALAGVIAALLLALMGLCIDAVLFPAAVGTVGLWASTVAAGITLGLLALEVRKLNLCAELL
jgi:hypothetical protein